MPRRVVVAYAVKMLFGFLPAGPDPHSFCGDHRASGLHSWASLGRGDCIVHLHRVSSRRGLRGDVRDCPLAASRYAHSRYNNSQLAVSPSEGSSPIEPSPSLSLPCWAPGRLPWPPESQIHTSNWIRRIDCQAGGRPLLVVRIRLIGSAGRLQSIPRREEECHVDWPAAPRGQ